MAVGAGAGALNPTKPVTVNDMMEAIQLPGLKPQNGLLFDCTTGDDSADVVLCTVGGAGYTEVLDDLIVEITEDFSAAGGNVAELSFGVSADGTAASAEALVAKFNIHDLDKGTYSILRGNDTDLAFATAYDAEHERTFGPGAVDADGVAVAARQGANAITCTVTSTADDWSGGTVRVYARTHYTAVNFGPGL